MSQIKNFAKVSFYVLGEIVGKNTNAQDYGCEWDLGLACDLG